MLYIDVGNTLRGGLRTGIQRVVRQLAFGLAAANRTGTRLIGYDRIAESYFALTDPSLISTANSLADIGQESRRYFGFDTFATGDIFFEPDSTWTEPINRGALFRRLKANGVIVVILNHDVIPAILPEVVHPSTLVSFAETIADHIQYADYALTTSKGVDRDLRALVQRVLGRSITTRVIKLGADFDGPDEAGRRERTASPDFTSTFPELVPLRFILSVGTIEPRKNHAVLLQAFDRLEAPDAGLVVVGRQGWMSKSFLAALKAHPQFGKRIFWYTAIDDAALRTLYRHAHASVLPSHYEGYGLPAVEALSQGSVTVVSDAGSLPEVTKGCAAVFARGDGDALLAVLDRLYREPNFHADLKEKAASFRPTSWQEAGRSVAAALADIEIGKSHDLASPLRQIVYLSVNPETLDLSLGSVRQHLPFIDRVVILTKPDARADIASTAGRHFADAVVLTDDELAGAEGPPSEHNPRNTWLRKLLYAHDVIEPNFLAADEDYLALRRLVPSYFRDGDIHTGYYFLGDMGVWLAGSPAISSYDRGIRNACRLLREAAYPARGFASHMPQIINKSLVNDIYDRFIVDADHAWLDEWSLYFNVAGALYPRHFKGKPYAALGWPMRMGDWLPDVAPEEPAFENYYPQNYASRGMFAGLSPGRDLAAKAERTRVALVHARRIELETRGEHNAGILALLVTEDALKFVATGTVVAGKGNVRRILLVNGADDKTAIKGTLDMFVTELRGTPVERESVALGEVAWMPLLPPESPGSYAIRFYALLAGGVRLETHGTLTVIADEEIS